MPRTPRPDPHPLTPYDDAGATPTGLLDVAGAEQLPGLLDLARDAVAEALARVDRPYAGTGVRQAREVVDAVDLDTPVGDVGRALEELREVYLDHAVWFHHPRYQAHLNCPVALPAVVADVVATVVNTSMDTWDQSGTATLVEQRLLAWVAGRIGFGGEADGVFTSGGTQSNLHGLLLAREAARARGTDPRRWCVVVPEHAHFSARRAAHLLGIAPDTRSATVEDGVLPVACDERGRVRPEALARTLRGARLRGLDPVAVVATAGTTDLGAVDPLDAVADVVAADGAWLHVDAAYGGGLLASPTRRSLLDGIDRADSVTVDFHKTWFMPVACSALVVRRGSTLTRHHADYLNPAPADPDEPPNLVDHSLQTTRRFDALKLWLTLRTLGADHLGGLLDRVCDLAERTREALAERDDLEVVRGTDLSTVVFRFTACPDGVADDVNDSARARLVASGAASVARTRLGGRTWLKLTLLDPATTLTDTLDVVGLVTDLAREETALRAADLVPVPEPTLEVAR